MTETCWFCKRNPADYSRPYIIPIHKTLEETIGARSYRATYRKSTVNIPRCRKCRTIHTATKIAKIIGYCLVVIAIGMGMWQPSTPDLERTAGILFLATLILLIGGRMIQRHYLKTHPELARLLKGGWKLGEEPSRLTG
jgi:predicted Abi (CAAX) family protease